MADTNLARGGAGRTRRPLVAGNWKMNGDVAGNGRLLAALAGAFAAGQDAGVDVLVCPPYPYLSQAADQLGASAVRWGAQDVSEHANGAFTGEVSGAMLRDLGCQWAIVGHSERRSLHAEDDALVARKAQAALQAGLGVIACVGESLDDREGGRTEALLRQQVSALAAVAGSAPQDRFVIAYEPVWAIGTGRSATPEIAQQAHAHIRAVLAASGVAAAPSLRILYGGSVKAANAASIFSMPDVDGGLIGGASLQADEFVAICRAAQSR